jgi:hypothetical protein
MVAGIPLGTRVRDIVFIDSIDELANLIDTG